MSTKPNLTKTRIGNHLRRHALGDQPTYRQGFKEGVEFAMRHRPSPCKPLIHEEARVFKEWFDAWWVGDGQQGESIPTRGNDFDDYLERYTLAFGAWMAAKQAAHSIKGQP